MTFLCTACMLESDLVSDQLFYFKFQRLMLNFNFIIEICYFLQNYLFINVHGN